MFRPGFIAITALVVLVSASAFAGTTYAVGTCMPNLPYYTTISLAVSSVPPGSTIKVCPGSYPEQVLIAQPLTLEGVPGASSAAVVVAPAGGLTNSVQLGECGIATYYQILVQNPAGPVNISNLVVDGTGAGNPAGSVIGVVYLDATGTVSEASARNQTNAGEGYGIYAATSLGAGQTITIENSFVHGFDALGISVDSSCGGGPLAVNIKANTINGGGTGFNGIYVAESTGNVASNAISGIATGVSLSGASVTATGNIISASGNGYGVFVLSGGNTVEHNRIDAGGGTGMLLSGSGTSSLVEENTIGNASNGVFGCGLGHRPAASGFTVTGNAITDAAVGVEMPSGNTSTPNRFYATASAVEACP
ncbi:MAG: right-handed parallel beta-helix repeat-containing protein [Terriglobales bacterium]